MKKAKKPREWWMELPDERYGPGPDLVWVRPVAMKKHKSLKQIRVREVLPKKPKGKR